MISFEERFTVASEMGCRSLFRVKRPMPPFQAERAGQFRWEYLANGPEGWQVQITRT